MTPEELQKLADEFTKNKWEYAIEENKESFIAGYNKSQETNPFTDDDMINFAGWVFIESFSKGTSDFTIKELLDIWKEQRIK